MITQRPLRIIAAAILATSSIASHGQVTGFRQHQAINMSVGSGEVVSFSPTQDTLAVTDNSAGGIRIFRHDGTSFSNHATVDSGSSRHRHHESDWF
jgi:hypothetical protein